ncbi:sulfotransferase [Planktothrix agardhii 1032]|uniref:sulfotransferase n=1 Tax=Planktothrix agardhii TaxID=1160 RepID=UPI001D0B03A8|nr:sulfotransferase [Planktothrix agardhii]MCB8777041.1 sulfotransferase [Planktothrix agardhii 1031]MCF3599452.1 sulfotransferase [Planktothrix agardhii 1032]
MQKSNTEQTVFIIAGMHRSGTSLAASILQSAGVHIGRRLMEATEFNAKGHFENLDFFEFHLDVFRSLGVNIDGWTLKENLQIDEPLIDRAKQLIEQNSLSSIWGWKEPRTTLFLDFWAKLLPEARFLLIYRSPWEVADSLYRRGDKMFQSQPELAIKYWQHYNQKILDFYNQEQHRCLLTNLKTIVQYQTAYIDTINHKFNVNLSHPAPSAYDPALLRTEISSNSQRPTLIDHYFPEAIELYQELEGRGWHPEQTPDFSWQELLKPSLYKTWAFQEWVNLRQLEIENKSLKAQLQEQYDESEEAKVIQAEAEQTKTQLKTAESLLEQSQSQLQETESVLQQSQNKLQETESAFKQSQNKLQETETVLEKSQTQLSKTESVLQQSHNQLNQTRTELETVKTQLNQAQFDVMRYQSQLHQTQEELEDYEIKYPQIQEDFKRSQSKLDEAEAQRNEFESILSQLTIQLQQAQKREERFQIQLHQSLEELEKTQIQLQQDQENLQESNNQVKQLKRDLKRSNSQLYQVESEFDLSHSQLQQSESQLQQAQTELTEIKSQFEQTKEELEQQQTYIKELETSVSQLQQAQTELTEIKSQFQETKRELKQKQAQVNQLQTELKRSQSQMYQLQIELAQSQLQIQQIQERQQLEQTLSDDPKKHNEMDYNLLIWDAWNAYRNGKLLQMKAHLQKALKLTTASPSEIILTWLESFSKLSLAQGMELDSESLTNSEEWQQLVRQMTAKKGVNLTEKSIKQAINQSSNQAINQVAVETATQAKPADAG